MHGDIFLNKFTKCVCPILHHRMLQGSTDKLNDLNDGGPQFAEVFVIYWVGAVVVTVNIKLLGGSMWVENMGYFVRFGNRVNRLKVDMKLNELVLRSSLVVNYYQIASSIGNSPKSVIEAVTSWFSYFFGFSSFFQSVCVLGYCVLPLTVTLIICRLVLIAQPQTTILFVVRCVIVLLAFAWSTFGKWLQSLPLPPLHPRKKSPV